MQMRLEYENGKPVLKCENNGVVLVIEFAENKPENHSSWRIP